MLSLLVNVPSRLDSVLQLDPAYQDERVRLIPRKSPSLKSKSSACHDIIITQHQLQALW